MLNMELKFPQHSEAHKPYKLVTNVGEEEEQGSQVA